MKTKTKFQLSALIVAIFQRCVYSDVDFYANKCSEYNPQNELDIELVN